jgi:hypothetical protein
MTRKYFVLSLLLLALVLFPCSACSPTAADMTPTPDTSIVWEDDFEDGDIEDWETYGDVKVSVNEGVLTTGPNVRGVIYHECKVSAGTWSFDLFYPEIGNPDYSIALILDQDATNGLNVLSWTSGNTFSAFSSISNGIVSQKTANLNKMLTGWNHFDITRDDSGNVKLYLNGELVQEYEHELTSSPQWFSIGTLASGPIFDNLVVRNKVVDIQP